MELARVATARRRTSHHRCITRPNLCVASIAAAGLLAIGDAAPAYADPALEYTASLPATLAGDTSAGWSFTTNQAVTVVAWTPLDPNGDCTVRLFDASGTVLASATVTFSDKQEGSAAAFYSQAISPVSRAADTTYYIAQGVSASSPRPIWTSWSPG